LSGLSPKPSPPRRIGPCTAGLRPQHCPRPPDAAGQSAVDVFPRAPVPRAPARGRSRHARLDRFPTCWPLTARDWSPCQGHPGAAAIRVRVRCFITGLSRAFLVSCWIPLLGAAGRSQFCAPRMRRAATVAPPQCGARCCAGGTPMSSNRLLRRHRNAASCGGRGPGRQSGGDPDRRHPATGYSGLARPIWLGSFC